MRNYEPAATDNLGRDMTIVRLIRLRREKQKARRCAAALVLGSIVTSITMITSTSGDSRYLVAPLLMLACLVAVYTAVLWSRDGRLPVFEVGTLLVAATFVYSAVPLLGFIAMGHQWAPWVDNRLLAYPFDAYEIALFGWRDALYLGTFIGVYLLVRRSVSARSAPLEPVPAPLIAAIVIVVAVLYAYKIAIMVGYGIDFGTPYSSTAELVARVAQMPLVLLQITVIVLAAFLVVKEALLLVMIRKWRSLKWRFILVAVLIVEVIAVAVRMGGRAEAVLLLLAFAALYDRFVRPVRLKWITIGGVLLIAGFLIQGHLRGLLTLRELTISNALTTSNEFQSLFTTSYDLYQRKHLGVLGPVPWQIYASDFYLLVPQQLLPFAKIDPAEWYLDVLGIRGKGVGFMFGVMSQAVLGLDWIELIIRGAVLGVAFGALHRWYVRHASSFWATLFYLFVGIWSFYTFRATTFWFVHFIVYEFVPVMIVIKTVEYALRRGYLVELGGRGAVYPAATQ
ncbi:MAG: hypothetical protein DMF73_17745 [Acidobacteria bacterium]|nr:MAG: hypothetical protein DMF73_17745 [Acidobacteriota bacterium]